VGKKKEKRGLLENGGGGGGKKNKENNLEEMKEIEKRGRRIKKRSVTKRPRNLNN